jgi:hypothetical protein
MAAFANREGGYLMFGIRDRPHEMDGMLNNKLDELDPRVLSQFLQNHFSPNIDWEHRVHEVGGKRFGLIYVWSTKRKPVVCQASNSKGKGLRDGDVFYRYQGETRLIGAGELHAIIDDRIERERKSWQDLLKRTAQISPPSVAYLDLESGRLSGAEGSLMISEDVLDKVKFIREGRFHDGGEPTLNVIGNVEVVSTVPVAVEHLVPVDPAISHPYLQRAVLRELAAQVGEGVANAHDLLSVRRAHDVDDHPEWLYRNVVGQPSPQYSTAYVNWLANQYRADAAFFTKARERYRELQS